MRAPLTVLAVLLLTPWPAGSAEADGQALSDYLDALNRGGLAIIYTSDLVTDEMRVPDDISPDANADSLQRILEPFGLRATAGPADSLLIVPLPDAAGAAVAETTEARPASIPEIVVTSSLHRIAYSTPESSTFLDRDLLERIPTTAGEAVRLTDRLPGTASGGVSSRNHLRGGAIDEVLFLLDGLRLYEPYHLKDFQTPVTVVNSSAIGAIDFYSGAYPAHFGDRMSGVMSIELRDPPGEAETEVALDFFNSALASSGTFGGHDKGEWLVTARRGNLDLVADVVDPTIGNPNYQDYLGHVAWDFGPRRRLSANLLVSDDKIALADSDRGEFADAAYTNQIVWINWRAEWTDSLASDTALSVTDIRNRRTGRLILPGIVSGSLDELREFKVFEFRQDWSWTAGEDWMLQFGANLKDLDAHYDFSSARVISAPFDSILGNQPNAIVDIEADPSGKQYAAYAELRWRLSHLLTLDLGMRWDQQDYTTARDDRQFSPRASILIQPADHTEVRLGWGRYYQAQEINELQVADGIAGFFPAQRADHLVLNLRHTFANGIEASASLYSKKFRGLRPRFENVFNGLTLLPELQFDRVRIAPAGATAAGFELMVGNHSSANDVLWWVNYAWAEVRDELPVGDVLRSWDQTHSIKGGLGWRWGRWDYTVAGEAHTGWPRTAMTGFTETLPNGSTRLGLDVSARNASRHRIFQSLDIRVSRQFELSRGDLTTYLEVTNVLNRANPCCTEYAIAPDGSLAANDRQWLPLVPSLGVVWRF